tara:strand:- start:147 stop:752 length:606 start_codon:yes stop_codon:yes gene_type:complete
MININPILYSLTASSCGALTTVPFDILQTKIVSNESIEIKFEELKILLLMTSLFSIQNGIYNWSNFLNNKNIRATLAGLSVTPFYIFLESKKVYCRLGLKPKYKKFIFWITIRQILVFITLYNILYLNISYSKFISAFFANFLGFPLRILAFKEAYPTLNYNFTNIKKTGILEIIKSSICDGITLYLIYNFKYSPFKNNII